MKSFGHLLGRRWTSGNTSGSTSLNDNSRSYDRWRWSRWQVNSCNHSSCWCRVARWDRTARIGGSSNGLSGGRCGRHTTARIALDIVDRHHILLLLLLLLLASSQLMRQVQSECGIQFSLKVEIDQVTVTWWRHYQSSIVGFVCVQLVVDWCVTSSLDTHNRNNPRKDSDLQQVKIDRCLQD